MVSTPDKTKNRGKYDPYNDMEHSDKDRIFRLISNAEKEAAESPKKETSNSTTDNHANETTRNTTNILRRGEQNQRSNSIKNPATSELQSNYRNLVQGRNNSTSKNGKNNKKKKGILRKYGPVTAIAGILFGGGFFFYAAQSMLAPHLSALYTQATDLQYTSYDMRNPLIMSYMLDGGSQIKITNTFTKKYTLFTPYMQTRLENNGIQIGHLTADGDFEAGQSLIGNKTALKYDGKIIQADQFQDEFASNASFRDAYYSAKRGRIAGFFDKSAETHYDNIGHTRNNLKDFVPSGDEDIDNENIQNTISEHVTSADGSINTVREDIDEDTNETIIEENGDDIVISQVDGASPEAKARAMVNNMASKVSTAGVFVCSGLRLASLASVAYMANQIYKSIAYFLNFMEPISKMLSGEGETSGVNEILNFMTKHASSDVAYVGEDGQTTTKTLYGSMVESSGSRLIMGKTVSPESAIQPFSFDNITKAATLVALTMGGTNVACSGAMAASAIISLTANAVPGGTLATFVVGAIAQTVGGIILTGVVAAIVNAIVPYIAKMFASNIFETYTGIPAGELFSQGAAAANFSLATHGSAYMPASEEIIKAQNQNTNLAIAREAEVDRLNHSPLDASNPNTFLGSIMSRISYLSYSNSIMSNITNIANIVGSSISSLNPAVAATNDDIIDIKYTTRYSKCRNNENAICDIYGYTIPASDPSTINLSPDDPTYQSVISPNLDEDGEIKDNSELAKFINFCVNRESPWWVYDANIANALQSNNIIINNLPVVDDIATVVDAVKNVTNEGWATGTTCMISSNNPRWDSEFKYYQRYIEDMRIIQSMHDPASDESNPVLTYQERYRAAHPVDNSFKGTLSRISGLSMNDVAFLIEYVDYSAQLAKYDPSTRDLFGDYQKPEVTVSFTENITPTYNILSVSSEPLFIDRRNYAV